MNDTTMERNYTALTLSNENGTYTVNLLQTEMPIGDVIDGLVIPLLLAVGYSQGGIDAAMGRDE